MVYLHKIEQNVERKDPAMLDTRTVSQALPDQALEHEAYAQARKENAARCIPAPYTALLTHYLNVVVFSCRMALSKRSLAVLLIAVALAQPFVALAREPRTSRIMVNDFFCYYKRSNDTEEPFKSITCSACRSLTGFNGSCTIPYSA
jgi:hypothetical protein